MEYLPHELIIQILLRLPVKSLLRFKCVSTTHSPTILFLSNSAIERSDGERSESDSVTDFQLATATPAYTIQFISHPYLLTHFQESLNPDTASTSLNLNFIPLESYSYISIQGSCRGFILLHCYSQQRLNNNIYIFNPSTRVHKKIPLSPFASNLDDNYFYGFGYDQSTDDYMLVSMSHGQNTANFSPHVVFFSLRDNMWKEIESTHFPYTNSSISFVNYRGGLLYNGTIHWLAFRHDLKRFVIIAFDLMERKLAEMHFPDDFEYVYDPCCTCELWVFGEFLSVWALGCDTVEIWVMKEYKMHSSWTKTLVLPADYFIPLCSSKSGDIIGTDGGNGWAKYNNKGHLLGHSYYNNSHGFSAAMYIESLLSLPANNEQGSNEQEEE